MIYQIKYYCLLILLMTCSVVQAQVFDIVVDKNGIGDYTTIQGAINSVAANSAHRTLIFVKRGFYNEKVVVANTKTNISLIGEDAENVIISWNDYQGKNGVSGADSYTLWADADGFYAENITIENTAGNVGQAVAIRTTGDTMVFNNCRFLGFQDTYYAHKRRQYNLNCTVEGATDFVYGDATTVFDSCTINCVKGGQYISAPADTKLVTPLASGDFLHGLLFRYCNIKANEDVPASSFYLGRPWQPNASSVFIQCKLSDHIKPEGWSSWSGDNHLSSVFAEYKNVNEAGELIDVATRVPWSYQLEETRVQNLYKLAFFFRKSGVVWDPTPITNALPTPSNFTNEGNVLTWNLLPDAIGYVILKNDSVIGFSTTRTFTDSNSDEITTEYAVKSVSKNGNLSKSTSDISTAVYHRKQLNSEIGIYLKYKQLHFSEIVEYKIFSISGGLLETGRSSSTNVSQYKNGIYLVQATTKTGKSKVKKIKL